MIKNPRGILALLTALNFVNYVDRYVVNSVGPSVQESLGLSDPEIATVGSIFMLGYMLTSPLFGWLGDRYPRKGLIAAGVAVWSLATAASGLAASYGAMLAARIAVGVGEASYATLAPTIIDELAGPDRKNRWLAVFYVAIPVGFSLGFVLGGWIDHLWGWRAAFFVAGGPGLLLALATLFIDEPSHAARERAPRGAYRALWNNRVYRSTVWGYVAQTFALGGFAFWAEFFLERRLCLDRHVGATYFGLVSALTGLVGTAAGGWIADRVPGADRTRVCLRVCAWSSAIAAPFGAIALVAKAPATFLIALAVCELAVFASTSPTNAAVLMSVPTSLRASAMAASIFAIHLLGDLVSPPLVGKVSQAFGDSKAACSGGTGLQLGMYALPIALALSAIIWWRGARETERGRGQGGGVSATPAQSPR